MAYTKLVVSVQLRRNKVGLDFGGARRGEKWNAWGACAVPGVVCEAAVV